MGCETEPLRDFFGPLTEVASVYGFEPPSDTFRLTTNQRSTMCLRRVEPSPVDDTVLTPFFLDLAPDPSPGDEYLL